MPGMTWESLLNSPQATAAGTALASSVALTDVSPGPNYVLPANFLQNGSALRFTAFGVFSTTATPTLLLGFYYGGIAGTALATTGAITTATTVTNVPWRLEVTTTIRTTGASGTAMSQGFCLFGTSVSAASFLPVPNTALATVTVDTTAAKALTVGAQWGTSSASNTLTCHGFYVESLGL
jgi:hypothetical protein